MRMPEDPVTFRDLIRGDLTFAAGSVPDYVIVRGNGYPLYTLTNPVDDALMEITHVLRGEDLLSSTPRQVVLYRALIELGIARVGARLRAPAATSWARATRSSRSATRRAASSCTAIAWLHPRGPAQLPRPARLGDRSRPGRVQRRGDGGRVRRRGRQPEPGTVRPRQGRVDQRDPPAPARGERLPRPARPVPAQGRCRVGRRVRDTHRSGAVGARRAAARSSRSG